jgi:glycosyltransferase involved in cell wall biosynthesis
MRIAFVAQPFDRINPPVQEGSLAIWLYQIARVCARRGHELVIFSNEGGLLKGSRFRHEGISYSRTRTGGNRLLNKALRLRGEGKGSVPAFASAWRDAAYAAEVGIQSRRARADIVHVINYSQFVPIIRRLNPRAKIVLHMQCEWLTQVDRSIISGRLRDTDLVIGCSEYITATIADAFPEYSGRFVTVPNAGVVVFESELTGYAYSKDVLFVGRVSPEKGIHDLIAAFHGVLERFPEARLRIVGGFGSAPLNFLVGLSSDPRVTALRKFYEGDPASDKDPYQVHLEQAAGAELGKRILFEGRVDYTATSEFYNQAALLANPSLSESFGMTLVEAMMHELPTIATEIGGMPFIVSSGETGHLVPPADPPALAAAICDILSNPERARQMGIAGRRRALEKFTWEASVDALLQQYERVAS